MVSYI
jgi:hypothetical protein